MGSNVLGIDAFSKRNENVKRSQELQARLDDISERAMLVFEYSEAALVEDLRYVFQNMAIASVESGKISNLFLTGTERLCDSFMDYLQNPRMLAKTELISLKNPEHLRWQATNAWLKYVTWQARDRSPMDALYLNQFAFLAFDLWVRLTMEKTPENLGVLYAFDACTVAAMGMYDDMHARSLAAV